VIVTVTESVVSALTGREGLTYVSPPQPREQALKLVALLISRGGEPAGSDRRWVAPIAGGRRLVTLTEEPA
jgi:hypothetical protein